MTQAVLTLTCPGCGANIQGGAPGSSVTCAYCKKTIQVPNWAIAQMPGTAQGPMPCPRCQTALFEGRRGNVVLHGCGNCGGVFADNSHTQRVIARFDGDAVGLAQQASAAARTVVRPTTPGCCPVCSGMMRFVNVDPYDLQLDICDAHGTWFDRDELQRLTWIYHQSQGASQPGGYPTAPANEEVYYEDSSSSTVGDAVASFAGAAVATVAVEAVFDIVGSMFD
ncbi:MAG: zf-TFIIB domain-containing protein [Polyangiaceae bacterium]